VFLDRQTRLKEGVDGVHRECSILPATVSRENTKNFTEKVFLDGTPSFAGK
jgi:hypothetical protein